MGSFVFKWPHSDADEVIVTGTFDNWGKSEKLSKNGDIFEKEVNLPDASQKIFYKFFVDGKWKTDPQAPQEDDGHHNVNNILKPEAIKTHGSGAGTSMTAGAAGGAAGGAAAGGLGAALLSSVHPNSTTAKLAGETPKETERATPQAGEPSVEGSSLGAGASPPGAFPETPAQEPDSFSVKPIPASQAASNPISLPPGEKLPNHEDVSGNTIDSKVTTSKEDYEKVSSPNMPEQKQVGVDPIPASAGIGNPVSVPAGQSIEEHKNAAPGAIEATSTTTKEDYKKAGSTAMPVGAAIAAGSGPTASAFSMPDRTKNMIPESSLPISGEAKDTIDKGPFIQSAGSGTTTAALAGQVPLEPASSGRAIPSDELPSATLTGPAADVPEVVKESMARSQEPPEAASSSKAVEDKKEVENELLKEVRSTEAGGQPAPTVAAAASTSAPSATAVPENPSDVKAPELEKRSGKDESTATPQVTTGVAESKISTIDTPKQQDATPAATATDPKKETTPPSSVTSPPVATDGAEATDKKNKRKSLFGKLKDKLKG